MDLYWEATKQRICKKCIDGDMKGNCRLPVGEQCPLEAFFPEIVTTVTTVQANNFEGYIDALRKNVCAKCEEGLLKGDCERRNKLECAVDRYFPLVVETIESVRAILREEASAASVR